LQSTTSAIRPGTGMTRPLHYLSLAEVSRLLRDGELSAVELTEAMLGCIAERDGELGAFIHVAADHARSRARALQDEIDAGMWRGPLHGVPVAVKDLIDTDFAPTTAGMAMHRDRRPTANAAVIERLEKAGAVVIGKLATTEGAFSEHHPDICQPRNPWNPAFWTGASSSGSGVATAAGLCFGTLGSDTGGSIRLPSSACGLTGVKPTAGLVSNYGVHPLAPTMDVIGPMARTAEDAAYLLAAIAGHDPRDPMSRAVPVPNYPASISDGIGTLRLGFAKDLPIPVHGEVLTVLDAAREVFAGLCANARAIDLPDLNEAAGSFMPFFATETMLSHAHTFPARRAEYGGALAALIDAGAAIDGATLARAAQIRTEFTVRFSNLMDEIDLLLLPALPHTTPRLPREFTAETARFTSVFNMSGHPTITLCGGFDGNGMPIGVQLVARHFREDLLLRAGHAFQQRTGWHVRHPD